MNVSLIDAPVVFDAATRIARNTIVDANGCWIWQGSFDGQHKYGRVSFLGHIESVHRVALACVTGGLREDDVNHLCEVTACANPSHLQWCTKSENESYKHRDSCAHGHPWTDENTARTPRGWRRCRECNRQAMRLRAARKAKG